MSMHGARQESTQTKYNRTKKKTHKIKEKRYPSLNGIHIESTIFSYSLIKFNKTHTQNTREMRDARCQTSNRIIL